MSIPKNAKPAHPSPLPRLREKRERERYGESFGDVFGDTFGNDSEALGMPSDAFAMVLGTGTLSGMHSPSLCKRGCKLGCESLAVACNYLMPPIIYYNPLAIGGEGVARCVCV